MRNLFRKGSLRGRLSRWLALQAAVGLSVVSVGVYVVVANTLSARQDEILEQKIVAIQQMLTDIDHPIADSHVSALMSEYLRGYDELSLLIKDKNEHIIFQSSPAQVLTVAARNKSFTVAGLKGDGGKVNAMLTLDCREDQALLLTLAWTLVLSSVGGAIAICVSGYWLVGRGLYPLRKLIAQTRTVDALKLDQRLNGDGQAEELQPLIKQFNALLDRLALAYKRMEAFNADVAHELKTPLSTLISSSELALRRPREPAELCELIASNLEELHRMSSVVGDMLFLANAERGIPARREHQLSLSSLALEVVDYHDAALQEAGLGAQVKGDASAYVDRALLRRAISNLLGNATRYAKSGTTITVDIREYEDAVNIDVCNHGVPIQEEQLPRIFDRFYRGDPSRAQANHNHGLGLAIVAAIAHMHGGSCAASSGDGVTRVGFCLRKEPLF